MVQMEGALASTFRIEHSKTRLERLGFFKNVTVETVPVPGASDQIDVNYSVEEQPSGSVGASIGFGGGTGLIFGANISQKNFIGSGNDVSFNISSSDFQDDYNFSFFDPYYTADGLSRGFSVFYKETNFDEANVSSFLTDTIGASLRYSYPISDTSRLGFEVRVENDNLKLGVYPAKEIFNFVAAEGNEFNTYSTSFSWTKSTLVGGLLATRGSKNRLSMQITLPGTDMGYIVISYTGEKYFRLTDTYFVRLKTRLAQGEGLDDGPFPFYEHFFAGGFGSVRGYRDNTIGPKSTPGILDPDQSAQAFGGNILTEFTAELIFRLPFVEDHSTFRSMFFVDAGNVFDSDRGYDLKASELKYSAGISAIWVTALAPLTFSFGKALNDDIDDRTQTFQFTLGAGF
jgi:outer membrane protein insertion porin family